METHICDIYAKMMETHMIFMWHSHEEKWDSSTQKKKQKGLAAAQHKGNVWNNKKQGGFYFK